MTDLLKLAALVAALAALHWLACMFGDWLHARIFADAGREADDTFPVERSGVVRRDGVEERKVAGE